jgi:hypothetical protein
MNEIFGFVRFTALLALTSLALLAAAVRWSRGPSDGQSALKGVAWSLADVSVLAFAVSLVFLQAFTNGRDVVFVVGLPLILSARWLGGRTNEVGLLSIGVSRPGHKRPHCSGG